MDEDVECMEPLNCHICGFECFSQNELKTHMGIHSGLKPFMCMICNEKFSQKSNLERQCSFYHGGCGHGQTSLNESNYGQSDETGVLTTGEISGMNKEDVHSNTQVTDSKRGIPRKTENNNVDPNLDNSTEDVICLSDEVTTANINNMKLVQSDRKGEKSGINKEEKYSDTTRRKRARTGKNENKTIHSKLDNCSEEVICLSNDGTTANVKGGQTNSLQCYICFKQFVWLDDLQVHLNIHTEEKPYMCPVCKCRFCKWDALKTHSLIHTAKDKKVPEDEKSEQLESHINLEERIASISETVVLPLKLSEKSADGEVESLVCNFCRTGFVDPNILESHSKGHLSEKPWLCNHCGESFHEEISLKLHHRNSHAGEKYWICHMCKKRFSGNRDLNHHLFIHAGKKPFKCNICDKGFTQSANLQVHTMTHNGEKPFKCSICDERFMKKQGLQIHTRIHTRETRFKCNICSIGINHKQRFQLHLKSHTEETQIRDLFQGTASTVDEPTMSTKGMTPKPFQFEKNCESNSEGSRMNLKRKSLICSYCKTGFPESNQLALHSKTHLDENPWLCNTCEESFPKQAALKPHRQVSHAGENHYICFKCKTRFKSARNLNNHLVVHTGVKPYNCNVCDKSFAQKTNLITHTRIHTGEKPFQCSICDKCFTQKQSLVIHERSHTREKPFKCNICDKGFTRKQSLVIHERSHTREKPFKCNTCDKSYTKKSNLEMHAKSHKVEKRFKRNMRNGRFSVHQRNGKAPFTCTICSWEFSHKQRFQTHMKSHTGQKQTQPTFHPSDASVNESIPSTKCATLKPLQFEQHFENKIAINSDIIIDLEPRIEPHTEIKVIKTAKVVTQPPKPNKNSVNPFHEPSTCTYCHTGFIEPEALKMHTESYHTGENPWICNHCQRKFQNQVKLKSHQRISHTGEKHWICQKCKQRCKGRVDLNRHLIVHTGQKPYKCNICKKRFNHIGNLGIHSKRHTAEKLYVCGFCHRRFKYEEEFKSHVQMCLPKTHESSECSFQEEEIVEMEEVRLNELIDENSVREIQLTKIVNEFSTDGSENLAPKLSEDINTQKPCCSSGFFYQTHASTEIDQDQFDKIGIEEKSSEPEQLIQSTDIDTTTCSKLSEENRRQEWTSFLNVFNIKVGRKF